MHRALLVTRAAAGALAIVELVAVPGPQLDHRVLGAGAQTAVALAAVAARQAAACLVRRLWLGQAAEYLGEAGGPLLRRCLRLLPPGSVPEVPQVQLAEADLLMLGHVRRGGISQPGVDILGRLLAVPHADPHGTLRRHHVAYGEHARTTYHHKRRHLHGAVAVA